MLLKVNIYFLNTSKKSNESCIKFSKLIAIKIKYFINFLLQNN